MVQGGGGWQKVAEGGKIVGCFSTVTSAFIGIRRTFGKYIKNSAISMLL